MSDRKKIVILARSIFPFQSPRSFRATELAKEFAAMGHDVTLYAVLGEYDYSEFTSRYKVKVKSIGGVRFLPVRDGKGPSNKSLKKKLATPLVKLINFPFIELMFKVPKVLSREKAVDVLITVAIPHSLHWGAALSKERNISPFPRLWIADCGDPFMGNEFDRPLFYFRYLENWAFKKADYITVPVEEARGAYDPEFRDKIKVIPQGFDFDSVDIGECRMSSEVPTFAYAGFFYKGMRDPTLFLDHLLTLKTAFRFIIYTRSVELVQPYISRFNGKLEVRDYVPREVLLKELAGMNFLVNFENGTSAQSPSKLIDYALTGRPILSVNSYRLNTRTISDFLSGNYEGAYVLENLERYNIKNVARQFLDLGKQ